MHAASITAVSPRLQHPARRAAAQQAARRPGPVRRAGRRPRPAAAHRVEDPDAVARRAVDAGAVWRCRAGDVLGRTPRRPARPLRASLGAVDRPRTSSPDDIAHRTPPDISTRASWCRPGPGARRPRWTCRSVVETAVVSAGPVPPVLVPPAGPPCPPTAQSPDGVHGRSCVCRGRHGGVRRNHGVSAGRRRTVRPPGGSCLSVLGQDPGREKLGRRQPNAILSRRTFSLPTVRPAPSSPFASTYAIPRPLQDNAPWPPHICARHNT